MRKSLFYILLLTLVFIEIIQILFCIKFLEWFKEHNIYPIYPILFSMSFIALGVMMFFLIKGIYSIKHRK